VRPNYFIAVYEDSDYEVLSAAAAKRLLQPADAQLPQGVIIPELDPQMLWRLGHTDAQERDAAARELQQQLAAAAVQLPLLTAVPPAKDLRQLLNSLDLSRVAYTADPVCCNQQLQQQLLQLGIPHLLQLPPTAAAIIIMAVQPASATAAITAALALQPAFTACYLPGEQLTAHLLQRLRQQQSWTVLRAGGGCWVCIASGALPIQHWLTVC
jgi:hypothetical protein